jgi:hypothetical protein
MNTAAFSDGRFIWLIMTEICLAKRPGLGSYLQKRRACWASSALLRNLWSTAESRVLCRSCQSPAQTASLAPLLACLPTSGTRSRRCRLPSPSPAPHRVSLPPHSPLQVLLLVPTAGSRLLPLVVANFPHKLRDRNTQCLYLRAAYALAEGRAGTAIREGLLAGVVEHLINIDVEIRWVDMWVGGCMCVRACGGALEGSEGGGGGGGDTTGRGGVREGQGEGGKGGHGVRLFAKQSAANVLAMHAGLQPPWFRCAALAQPHLHAPLPPPQVGGHCGGAWRGGAGGGGRAAARGGARHL